MTAPASLLLHVGLHKTGTTWLQRNLFERLHGHEIEYFGDIRVIYGRLIAPSSRSFDPAAARDAFAPTLDRAAETGRLAVLSGEGLAGRPFHQKHVREVVAARLAETFPEAHVLLTIREQVAIIYSMYGQYIRFGYTSALDDFLAAPPEDSGFQPILDRDFYDYDMLLADYEHHFPPDHVTILPFEWLVTEPEAAIGRLSARLGRPLTPPDETARGAANPAWSDLAYAAARQLNRTVSQDSRWRRKPLVAPNAVAARLDALTPGALRRAMRARRLDRIREAVGDRYAASNRAVGARIGIDLGRLGYRV